MDEITKLSNLTTCGFYKHLPEGFHLPAELQTRVLRGFCSGTNLTMSKSGYANNQPTI